MIRPSGDDLTDAEIDALDEADQERAAWIADNEPCITCGQAYYEHETSDHEWEGER